MAELIFVAQQSGDEEVLAFVHAIRAAFLSIAEDEDEAVLDDLTARVQAITQDLQDGMTDLN